MQTSIEPESMSPKITVDLEEKGPEEVSPVTIPTLYHHPLSPACRFVRMILSEHEKDFRLVEEHAWDRRPDFLQLNAAGSVPVMEDDDGTIIVGETVIAEYCDEEYGASLGEPPIQGAAQGGRSRRPCAGPYTPARESPSSGKCRRPCL